MVVLIKGVGRCFSSPVHQFRHTKARIMRLSKNEICIKKKKPDK